MRMTIGDLTPSTEFTAINAATGAELTSLSGLAATYQRFKGGRPLAAPVTINGLTALGSATAAWSSAGYYHLGSGVWRLDLPIAAVAVGSDHADRVVVSVSATDATIVTPLIELVTEIGSLSQEDIDALLRAIVDRQVVVVGPPVPANAANVLTIFRGDDYLEVDGTEIVFEGDAPPADDLDIANVTVYLIAQESLTSETILQIEASDIADNGDDTVTVKFELDHTDSAILAAGSYLYFERWVWSDGTVKTRQRGTMVVEEAWPVTE